MSKTAVTLVLLVLLGIGMAGPAGLPVALDSLYQFYGNGDLAAAEALLGRLEACYPKKADQFTIALERGDFLLDKQQNYAAAESVYARLAEQNPKHKLLPDVLYRLALAQEMQEKYLDAARNYEKVATRYSKSTYGTDALDAIERCFRKNYQERVAFVDGYPITRIELDDRISRNPSAYDSFPEKQALLDTMIDARLLYAAALSAGITKNPAYLAEMKDARNRAMFSEWYERTVNAKAQPTDKEIAAAYNRDLASRYSTPEKVHGWQIVVATRAEAESLRRLLTTDTTEVWDSVAKRSSTAPDKERGGDMGLFARGVQSKEIEGAAFKLAVGEISQPIQTKDGFALLRVTEKKPKTVRTLADVKSTIAADLRQQNTTRLYDAAVAALKQKAAITQDTTALAANRDTLATVNGQVITQATLAERIEAIPPFFRSQFDSPEGKRRILDQLILEKLLSVEAEKQKLWLVNKVVDQVLTRRNALLTDTYKQTMTTDKVKLDSLVLDAEYKATIADFKEPTKVHVREIAAPSEARAEQIRRWAVAGKLPPMIHGRALLAPDTVASAAAIAAFRTAANTDSVVIQRPLAPTPKQLPRLTLVQSGGKSLPDMGAKMKLAGPYQAGLTDYGLAFADFTREDKLYKPELVKVESPKQLYELLGFTPDSAALADTSKAGAYVKLAEPLAASVTAGLLKADNAAPVEFSLPSGLLLVKTTKRDTAQKASFADIARRFSQSSTRWSGGDLYWLAKDDKVHDAKLVKAAFALSKDRVSPVMKLNDSTWVFVTNEERKDAYTRPFSEVKSKIENKLRRNQEKVLYDEMIRSLRTAAKVEVTMKESDFVVEPPVEPVPAEGSQPQPAEPQK